MMVILTVGYYVNLRSIWKNIKILDFVCRHVDVHFGDMKRAVYFYERRKLTPFFPGMAHSQFIRFMVPSAFLVGTATKPCVRNMKNRILLKTWPKVLKMANTKYF